MSNRPSFVALVVVLAALGFACGGDKAPAPTATSTAAPETEKPSTPEAPAAAAPAPAPTIEAPADPNEACARVIVVAYKGAASAAETVTREKPAALARATELAADPRIKDGFAELAKTESDAPNSAPRGGLIGTYVKDKWPEPFAALKDAVFALQVNETAKAPIDAPFGYALVQRCKVDKRHARHILIRYKGAKKAGPEIKRSKDDAMKLAVEVQQKLSQGGDFAELAKKYSEDGSKDRGGDIGTPGLGLLAPAFEESLWKLKVGELSTVVETDFGFHVIQRLPDEVAPPQ